MTGAELKAIRRQLGMTVRQFGRAVGYVGSDNTVSVDVRRYESGARPIPDWLAGEAKRLRLLAELLGDTRRGR